MANAEVPTESPELDARVLLAFALGVSSSALLARWGDILDDQASHTYEAALDRRAGGEPVAWIVGEKEFWGRSFVVTPGVLVPRPDTETLVEAALEVDAGPRIADVCCGTGCVGLTLACERPRKGTELALGDVSDAALDCARSNADQWMPTARVVRSDLLEHLVGPWNLVVSNPPYLTRHETESRVRAGWREPSLALDGGTDGLDLVQRLVAEAFEKLAPNGWLLIEAADPQAETIAALMGSHGYRSIRTWSDLGGRRRVTGGRRA